MKRRVAMYALCYVAREAAHTLERAEMQERYDTLVMVLKVYAKGGE